MIHEEPMTFREVQRVSGWADRHFERLVSAGVFDEARVNGNRIRPHGLLFLSLLDEMMSLVSLKQITPDQAAMIVRDLKPQLPILWMNARAGVREKLTVEFPDKRQAPIVLKFVMDAMDRVEVNAPLLMK
jgi:hypothetical protein